MIKQIMTSNLFIQYHESRELFILTFLKGKEKAFDPTQPFEQLTLF